MASRDHFKQLHDSELDSECPENSGMASVRTITGLVRRSVCPARSIRRSLHQTSSRHAITNLEMPAMSPTMSEGGISSWKKREGEAFSAGDVLLEIETDKATIDVEAQEDGIMGKILLPDGSKNIPVGKVIALLAEEGDDISNLEPPKEEKPAPKEQAAAPKPPSEPAKPAPAETPSPTPQSHPQASPSHSRPIFPSVHRLLLEHSITNPENIKGTGVRGMLTKGDILTHLGKASSPTGTYKQPPSPLAEVSKIEKKVEPKPLDGAAIRRLIVTTMLENSIAAKKVKPVSEPAPDFDSIIADYLPRAKAAPKPSLPPPPAPKRTTDYLDGLY
ncbi:putative e3 binding domain containing protein [Lyophyllum shimeji]|uniref:E3 binding domain containing protein n=1 Tax=Lyophyllum shimeji TaxID=47721 RepID=A0A9P3PHB9_LYOSH|nr:putative e3 binding domain containing protein [Lyophyllum shimeji]